MWAYCATGTGAASLVEFSSKAQNHAASLSTAHCPPPLESPVSGLAPNPTMTYVSCRSHGRASIGGRLIDLRHRSRLIEI